jgi:NADPH-dependent 7-cyano-7-deazaguanine reductase QueF
MPRAKGLELSYRPKESLVESKSLKLYLWGFRDKGIFAEISLQLSSKTSSQRATR